MKPATRIADALGETAAAPLIQRARRLEAITAALRAAAADVAPDLISRCELSGETLNVVAENPAKAAKLRQKLPQFQRVLADCGVKVTSIRVVHQPGLTNYHVQAIQEEGRGAAVRAPPMDVAGPLKFADELARTHPNSAVGKAAQQLLLTLGKYQRR